jgi:RNA polymerase sigma factor (sigma-70 family)
LEQANLDEVIVRYERRLIAYATRLTGSAEAAQDVVQEAFLRLCRNPLPPDANLTAWLYAVCRNLAIDRHRKEHRMTPLDAGCPSLAEIATVDHATEVSDESQRVRRVLSSLPFNQQEVVRLKFEHDLSYAEIAGVTKLTVGNVGFLLHTALSTIRDRLSRADQREGVHHESR